MKKECEIIASYQPDRDIGIVWKRRWKLIDDLESFWNTEMNRYDYIGFLAENGMIFFGGLFDVALELDCELPENYFVA